MKMHFGRHSAVSKSPPTDDAKHIRGERRAKIDSPLSSEANYNSPESARPRGHCDRRYWQQVGPLLRLPQRSPARAPR
jgi:hypothetical protein